MRLKLLEESVCLLPIAFLIATFAMVAAGAKENPASAEARLVAALDKQYQAAVKQNDAGTMNRILAEDFVLVTGSGKVVSKDELLTEAGRKRIKYQGQEDNEQTVRGGAIQLW